MAINQGTETLAITSSERTWRINIETGFGADPVVTIFREVVKTAPDGTVVSRVAGAVAARGLSAIVAETQPFTPAAPGQITGAELAGLIAARADLWRAADIAAAKT